MRQHRPVQTYVVGEIGTNHNGELSRAFELIDSIADAGCDAVKFQKRTPLICVPPHQRNVPRSTPWGTISYLEYRERLEFHYSEYSQIAKHCDRRGIAWFGSAWDIPSLEFLEKFDPPFHKIPSACLTDDDLVKAAARLQRSLLLSTGMSTFAEIEHAVSLTDTSRITLLHCTAAYPTPHSQLNLRMIPELRHSYRVPVGYSGHEEDLTPTYLALALGACYVERHVTFDKKAWGTDHHFSLLPEELKTLVRGIRDVEQWLGDGKKRVYNSELPALRRLRRVQVRETTAVDHK